ncbi:MAG: hypothetical protein QG667_1770 [Pseudomonadota bacterium]|nr:hypothetical protein [Pseudomonadota bacterium]
MLDVIQRHAVVIQQRFIWCKQLATIDIGGALPLCLRLSCRGLQKMAATTAGFTPQVNDVFAITGHGCLYCRYGLGIVADDKIAQLRSRWRQDVEHELFHEWAGKGRRTVIANCL